MSASATVLPIRLAHIAVFALLALLASCGGGGGGGVDTAGQGGNVPSALSSNIAAWGDSLTPAFALNLQVLMPERVVFNGGVPGETSTQVAMRLVADSDHHNWITIFWAGQNNEDQPAQIKADIAASLAALAAGNSRFIVISVMNKASEPKGTPAYAVIMQLNAELAARYPNNYLDIRSLIVNRYDPNQPQDVIDFYNDVPPTSLRFDAEGHLRNEASVMVAAQVKQFIVARSW
jgi:hypothetical protein